MIFEHMLNNIDWFYDDHLRPLLPLNLPLAALAWATAAPWSGVSNGSGGNNILAF